MEAFFNSEEMKKHRRGYLQSEIIFLALYAVYGVVGNMNFKGTHILYMLSLFYLAGAGLLLEKYLSFQKEGNSKEFLAGVLKYHAFDSRAYFRKVFGRVALLELVMAAGISISFAVNGHFSWILWALLLLGLPALLVFLVKLYFVYRMQNEISVGLTTSLVLLYGIVRLVCVLILFVYGLVAIMGLYAIVSNCLAFQKMAEDVATYRVYKNVFLTGLALCMGLYIAAVFYGLRWKAMKYIRWALVVAFVVCFIGGLVTENRNNVTITENSICHAHYTKVTEYDYDDIKEVKAFVNLKGLQVELVMKDGQTFPLLGDESTNNDAWDQKYASVYNFLADVTRCALEHGATGSVTEPERIRDYVKEFDPKCIQGIEEMLALLQK